mmetsp:Transcript_951/g.3072  ORF Transcript_951/g.3072 Transcript_951/m.3072 type:complete len:292 (-) Transcript_951:272-1147(-)
MAFHMDRLRVVLIGVIHLRGRGLDTQRAQPIPRVADQMHAARGERGEADLVVAPLVAEGDNLRDGLLVLDVLLDRVGHILQPLVGPHALPVQHLAGAPPAAAAEQHVQDGGRHAVHVLFLEVRLVDLLHLDVDEDRLLILAAGEHEHLVARTVIRRVHRQHADGCDRALVQVGQARHPLRLWPVLPLRHAGQVKDVHRTMRGAGEDGTQAHQLLQIFLVASARLDHLLAPRVHHAQRCDTLRRLLRPLPLCGRTQDGAEATLLFRRGLQLAGHGQVEHDDEAVCLVLVVQL